MLLILRMIRNTKVVMMPMMIAVGTIRMIEFTMGSDVFMVILSLLVCECYHVL